MSYKALQTRRYFAYSSGKNQTNLFTYQSPFGLYFNYIYQVYDHKQQMETCINLLREDMGNQFLVVL